MIKKIEYDTFIWFLVRASFAEVTANILIQKANIDAWISIIIGIIIGFIPVSLYQKLKEKNIIKLNKEIGKIGNIFNLIIVITIFLFTLFSFWTLLHFIDYQFLYETKTEIITVFLIAPIIYAVTKKLHIISKVSLILFYTVIFFIILTILGLINGVDINNIKPILNTNKLDILKGSYYFIALNILPLFILTFIPKEKIQNYTKKNTTLFYIISTLSLLNVMFLTLSIFKINLAELYDYPCFHILKRVSVLEIIDRVESILSLEWVLALYIQIIISLFYIKAYLKETFKTKTNSQIITVCLIIAILCNCIFKTNKEEYQFLNIIIPLIYISFFIIPLISYKIFKNKKRTHTKNE